MAGLTVHPGNLGSSQDGEVEMMRRQPLVTCVLVPAALFTLGFLKAASADVAIMDEFKLTLSGPTPVFDDKFSAGLPLVGGAGTVLPAGTTFSDGSPAFYFVLGTVSGAGNKAILDTALGDHIVQPPPFFSAINLNNSDLLTGRPGAPFSLTPHNTFTTTGLFDVSVPATPGGFYQLELSGRVVSNMGNGDVLSMQVFNCSPSLGIPCVGSDTGPFIRLEDANFLTNTSSTIAEAPLDTSNQQMLFELSHPSTMSDTIFGSYAYVNNGIEGPLIQLGSYNGLFQNLNYTQAGFTQLAPVSVPEPSSLALLAPSIPGVLGIVWLRRRREAGPKSATPS
jgi:hypothetical protein